MDDVTVVIPWRPQPQRLPAFEYVMDWWMANGFKVVLGDSAHQAFNVSAARNAGVRKAETELVIVADADTVPSLGALRRAIQTMVPNLVTYPFNSYIYTEADPATFNPADIDPVKTWRNSVGGLLVTTRSAYWSIGGMDENFRRWGWDDNAFHLAAETLIRVGRVVGTVYAFGHDADRDMSKKNPGRARFELYKFARGNADVMRELVRTNHDHY